MNYEFLIKGVIMINWIRKQIDIIYFHQQKKIKELKISKEFQSELLKETRPLLVHSNVKLDGKLKFQGIEIVDANNNILFDWDYDE